MTRNDLGRMTYPEMYAALRERFGTNPWTMKEAVAAGIPLNSGILLSLHYRGRIVPVSADGSKTYRRSVWRSSGTQSTPQKWVVRL